MKKPRAWAEAFSGARIHRALGGLGKKRPMRFQHADGRSSGHWYVAVRLEIVSDFDLGKWG